MKELTIRKNKWLFAASICMLGYSILELSDSIIIILMALNLIPNLYSILEFSVPMIQQLLESQPLILAPIFWAFTLMRIVSTIGLFKNLLWGYYIGLLSLILTMILTVVLFLPVGGFELLGCTNEEFKDHISSQFKNGMDWDRFNNGEIHIDHIKPCCTFDLTDENQLRVCFHYTNLQPLWAIDNYRKAKKYG